MNAPGEMLVDIAHCVDYASLYSLTFVNAQFHNVAIRNAEKMAKRQNFELTFTETAFRLAVDGSTQMPSIVLDEVDAPSLAKALKEVASVVGLHAVTVLSIDHGDWLRIPIAEMFAILPALQYAISLSLRYAPPAGMPQAADYIDALVRNFPRLQKLALELHRPFDWTCLRRESALKPRILKVDVRSESQSSEEEVLRYCEALGRLPGNEPKRFVLTSPFRTDRFRQEEVERIVEVLSESQRVITLVLPTGPHLQLPERNFRTAELEKDGKKNLVFKYRRASVVVCVAHTGHTMITNAPKFYSATDIASLAARGDFVV
ncbi:hypothetical protein AAVH_28204 [Aphelenchoides avenae]|nr:hypothetical protein AAVH_28204 [Aphelenchus avenae]